MPKNQWQQGQQPRVCRRRCDCFQGPTHIKRSQEFNKKWRQVWESSCVQYEEVDERREMIFVNFCPSLVSNAYKGEIEGE